ncbi:putative pantoate--beta-alanine ligase-like [Capsicum annuum]|nr:putative pantoate--beta-alanine ligase-like [Capsicum annuum]
MKYVKGLTLMNGGKDLNALVQTKACDVKSNRIVDINIRIKEKGVKIEVIIDTAVVLNQEMGNNMVSLPMFQNGSQIIQAYYNKKGEDQAYGGVGQLPNRGGKADTVVAKSLNKEFRPKIKEQMQYCVNHPEEINKLAKVKAQVSE